MSWGLLLITDAESTEPIPQWASDADQLTTAETAAVLRVLHGDEGDTLVEVYDNEADLPGPPTLTADLRAPSKTIRVSDALGEHATTLDVSSPRVRIHIQTNTQTEPDHVQLAISPLDAAGNS